MFWKKTTQKEMAECLAFLKEKFSNAPASKFVIHMHAVLERFESAYAAKRQPSESELKQLLGEMAAALEVGLDD
jgi:hypothetical protein